MRIPARTGLLAAVLVGALSLTACGGSTVDSDTATPTTVTPLERGPKGDADETSTSTSRPRPATPQPEDQGAREIDEIPSETPRSAADVTFLGDLTDAGVDVAGVEDQLIGTAATVCSGTGAELMKATVPAVAGQLIEQGRTDKSLDEVTGLIESAAKNAYC